MRYKRNKDDSPHIPLEYGEDAYGHIITPEFGYRILAKNEHIQIGDKYFDIYSGWTSAGEKYIRNKYSVRNRYYPCGYRYWSWERLI